MCPTVELVNPDSGELISFGKFGVFMSYADTNSDDSINTGVPTTVLFTSENGTIICPSLLVVPTSNTSNEAYGWLGSDNNNAQYCAQTWKSYST